MDIKRILKNFNVDESVIEDMKEAITKEIGTDFIPKTQYQKKIQALDELQEKYNDLEATSNNDTSKTELETIKAEFEAFKNNIETEKINSTKKGKLTELLKKEGANEKLIGLLLKEFDLEKIELEEDNIKDWENVIKPVKEGYSDCFSTIETVGTPSATPPQNITGNAFTKEQINNMSESEINANWDSISKSLENLR